MNAPAIRIHELTLRHDRRDVVRALSGVFPAGSLTALVGPNGAGKTTLLRSMVGLHRPFSGRIDRQGVGATDIALLPQGSQLDRQFPITCQDVVALGLTGRLGPFRPMSAAARASAREALAAVGLPDHGARPIGALSAGQFQRVLFARMMLQDAPVLLLDEPFSAVDAATEEDLLRLLDDWHAQGRTIVAVLHDLDLVRAAFPNTLLLAGEKIAWGPTETVLTEANCRRAGLLRDRRRLLRREAA